MELIFLNTNDVTPDENRQILLKVGNSFYTVSYDKSDNEFYCPIQGIGWDIARLEDYPEGLEFAYLD